MNESAACALRPMCIEDHPAAYALWRRSEGVTVRAADERDAIARYLQHNPGTSFVAYVGEDLIGTILAGTDGRRVIIHHLAVDAAHQGRGIGRALLHASLEALRRRGIEKAMTFVFLANESALGFWRAQGWTQRDELALFSCVLGDDANA
jgi:ribosomal protein S18 acetylase RimI-like enzyme